MNDLAGLDPFDPQVAMLVENEEREQLVDKSELVVRFIERRKSAYAKVFGNKDDPDVQFVVEDLAYFSRAFSSTFDLNERVQTLREGRKEVFWRIWEHVQLPFDTLFVKYTNALNERNGK